MLLEFSVSNFRSIKDEQTLSMLAESSQAKPDNMASVELSAGGCLSVLKSAVIYGANASGKTNIIKAFFACISFIQRSATNIVGDAITCYDPFLFEQTTASSPIGFKLQFIGTDKISSLTIDMKSSLKFWITIPRDRKRISLPAPIAKGKRLIRMSFL